ncbi:hypothetical protein GCM10009777_03550 [Microbacterium pumilum]|uniref:Uncharacterized protein n=1 Tax=Microbacterium pumilum TaxID=344165 RepID=A0ABN2RSX5_9MICO
MPGAASPDCDSRGPADHPRKHIGPARAHHLRGCGPSSVFGDSKRRHILEITHSTRFRLAENRHLRILAVAQPVPQRAVRQWLRCGDRSGLLRSECEGFSGSEDLDPIGVDHDVEEILGVAVEG